MDYDQITPHIFLGGCPRELQHIDQLKNASISAVLNLQTVEDFAYMGINWNEMEAHYRISGMEIRHLPVIDFDHKDLSRNLPKCVRALDELLRDGHTAYVHCTAGVNRSPSTVIAYLHWIEKLDLHDAARVGVERAAGAALLDDLEVVGTGAADRETSDARRDEAGVADVDRHTTTELADHAVGQVDATRVREQRRLTLGSSHLGADRRRPGPVAGHRQRAREATG